MTCGELVSRHGYCKMYQMIIGYRSMFALLTLKYCYMKIIFPHVMEDDVMISFQDIELTLFIPAFNDHRTVHVHIVSYLV